MTYLLRRRAVALAGPLATHSRSSSNWIAGGLLVLIAAGCAGCDSGDKPAAASATASAASAPDGGNTRSAAEGSFAFTVTGSKCGVKTVGPADVSQETTGQFCLIDVSVKNVGKQSTLLDGSAQKAVDAQGKQYSVADLASVYLNDKDPTLLEEITPGTEVKGVLPFQVPANTKLTAIVLHAAVSTPGVRVALS